MYHQRGGKRFLPHGPLRLGPPYPGSAGHRYPSDGRGIGTCQQAIGTYSTNSTGSVLITPNIGSYYVLLVAYEGANYTINAPIKPMTTTYVTLNVPSGNVTITEVYEDGCQTSTGGVTCPG